MTHRLRMRSLPPDLVERYKLQGLWDDSTLGAVLADAVELNPSAQFRIWSDSRPYDGTVGDVASFSRRLASALRDAGVGPGDIVTLQVPNWMEGVAAVWAAAFVGAVIVPMIDAYSPNDVAAILRETASRLHIAPAMHRDRAYVDEVLSVREVLPQLQHVWSVESLGERLGRELDEPGHVDPDDPAVLCYTSGSSASPKGVIHTHRTFLAEIRQQIARLWPPSIDRDLVVSPIGHMAGLVRMVVTPVLRGHPVFGVDRWQPQQILDIVREHGLTTGSGVPYFIGSLLEIEDFGPDDVVHVRHIGTGGAPIPDAIVRRADQLGISVVRGYGATEHPTVASSSHDDPCQQRLFTEGRPLAGVELRIVDRDRREVPQGSVGDLLTRGPELCMGYVDPSHNGVFDDYGWFDTGDRALIDATGALVIKGRSKDIVIRGGENISAATVEHELMHLPEILQVAVVAAPDERFGERVCAFVTCVQGASVDLDSLRRALIERGVNRLTIPEEVHVVEGLPYSAAGKVDKGALRKRVAAMSEIAIGGEQR